MVDIRSISQVGTYEPFELQVARGQIPGHRSVVVFGYNPDVDTSRVTVWPYTGILPLPAAAAANAGHVRLISDNGAGNNEYCLVISTGAAWVTAVGAALS